MLEKDAGALADLPVDRLNLGTSEIRNWMVVSGAAGDLDMKLIDYVPCYRSPAGTGTANGFYWWNMKP
jgi:hypothetical protein